MTSILERHETHAVVELPAIEGELVVGIAHPLRRFLAWGLDFLFVAGVVVTVGSTVDPSGEDGVREAAIWSGALLFVLLYHALCEGGGRGQTLGKWALGVAVRDRESFGAIGYRRALGRSALRLVLWVFGFGVLPVFDGIAALRDRTFRRSWHDGAVDSVVVRVTPIPEAGEPSRLRTALGTVLVAGWTGVLLSMFFEPDPDPHAVQPWWGGLVFGVFSAALVAAAVLGARGRWRLGLGASAAASGFGLVAAYECAATSHHPQGWWLYELVAFGCLGALSLACLAVRGGLRRAR